LQMMRAEQRQHLSEQKLKEEELNTEKIRNTGYKRSLMITIIALLAIGGVLAHLFAIYRKKRAAYQELVRKSQVWASVIPPDDGFKSLKVSEFESLNSETRNSETRNSETRNSETRNSETRNSETRNSETSETGEAIETAKPNEPPDETDYSLMNNIEKIMSEDKLYTDPSLSVDSLALRLGAKRHYVSNAINRCTQKSFSAFVNEYRIKAAVQLLSKTDATTIDTISFEVGFNDRQNFYRVFKKMTGLSPTEFRFSARGERG